MNKEKQKHLISLKNGLKKQVREKTKFAGGSFSGLIETLLENYLKGITYKIKVEEERI